MNFGLTLGNFTLTWQKNYGIDKRRGWSVVIDGIVYVQFKRWLIVALFTAWRRRREREVDNG